MTKREYISILEKALGNFTKEEKDEILYDYEEHFAIGLENGKTEEEIALQLGDPRSIAKQYKVTQTIEKAQERPSINNIFNAVFSVVSLGFFNLVFVLGPFIGLIGIMIGLFGASAGVTIYGLGVMLGSLLSPLFPQYIYLGSLSSLGLFFLGTGFSALGLLFIIFNCYFTKYVFRLTVKYLQWNLSFINSKGGMQIV